MSQVGPKRMNLKVKNFEEFQFQPQDLVANISHIYINLGEDDNFCRAVSRDGRSYSHKLFEQAEIVLIKIHESVEVISNFKELGDRIQVPSFVIFMISLTLDRSIPHDEHIGRSSSSTLFYLLSVTLLLAIFAQTVS